MITDIVPAVSSRSFYEVPSLPARRVQQQEVRASRRRGTAVAAAADSEVRAAPAVSPAATAGTDQGDKKPRESLLVFGGTLSPADLRYLDEILDTHGLGGSIVAGVDDGLDATSDSSSGESDPDHPAETRPDRACKLEMAMAVAKQMGLKCHRLSMPIGIARTDEFLHTLRSLGSAPQKNRLKSERTRLVMRLARPSRVLADRRLAVFAEDADYVAGVVSLVLEAGMLPVLCASRADVHRMRRCLESATPELTTRTTILQADGFRDLHSEILAARPDVLIAGPEACSFAERMQIPLVCASRSSCHDAPDPEFTQIGYRGAMHLLDRLELALGTAASGR